MFTFLLGTFLAVLPKRWRQSLPILKSMKWRTPSTVSGFGESLFALVAMMYWYSYSMTTWVSRGLDAALAGKTGPDVNGQEIGFMAMFIFATHPLTWLIAYIGVEGSVRLVGAAFAENDLGILPLFVLDKILLKITGQSGPSAAQAAGYAEENWSSYVGAIREKVRVSKTAIVPDELSVIKEGAEEFLEIRACRGKQDWTAPRTVRYQDTFYRLEACSSGSEPRPFRYRLRRLSATVCGGFPQASWAGPCWCIRRSRNRSSLKNKSRGNVNSCGKVIHEKSPAPVAHVFLGARFSTTIPRMAARRQFFFAACVIAGSFAPPLLAQQTPLPSSSPATARILLLPRRIVSGERATLAVLDVNGRLTPGVTVTFSNGDRLKTDATGRALFVAPLNPGVILGSIEGRPGRVATVILTPVEAAASSMEISSTPRVASLTDRFEILGKGFCGDADANQVTIAGHGALVLASSPVSLVVLPSMELDPGPATVALSCLKRKAPQFSVTFVGLELKADPGPLKRGEHRALTVRVRGTTEKISLEASNLAPDVTELVGGNPVQRLSTGGEEQNVAEFEVIGKKNGTFLISIRLVPTMTQPHAT